MTIVTQGLADIRSLYAPPTESPWSYPSSPVAPTSPYGNCPLQTVAMQNQVAAMLLAVRQELDVLLGALLQPQNGPYAERPQPSPWAPPEQPARPFPAFFTQPPVVEAPPASTPPASATSTAWPPAASTPPAPPASTTAAPGQYAPAPPPAEKPWFFPGFDVPVPPTVGSYAPDTFPADLKVHDYQQDPGLSTYGHSGAMWINNPNGEPDRIRQLIQSAGGKMPVIVQYTVPDRDAGGPSQGGASNVDQYLRGVEANARAIGNARAFVVMEPDAMLLGKDPELIKWAMETYKRNAPNARVFLDIGHSKWKSPEEMAQLLRRAGIDKADGFTSNVSNYHYTDREIAFGEAVRRALGAGYENMPHVIDTSRNKNGEGLDASGNPTWGDPVRAVGGPVMTGLEPGTRINDRTLALWVKPPGEGDGLRFPPGAYVGTALCQPSKPSNVPPPQIPPANPGWNGLSGLTNVYDDPRNQGLQTYGHTGGLWLSEPDGSPSRIQELLRGAGDKAAVVVQNTLANTYDNGRYLAGVENNARAIGSRPAVVVLEPNALALGRDPGTLRQAVEAYKRHAPNARILLDIGHSNWRSAWDMAQGLKQAGIDKADGFTSNVSNYNLTQDEKSFGEAVRNMLGAGFDKLPHVIDTSRNKNGVGLDAYGNRTWGDPVRSQNGPVMTGLVPGTKIDERTVALWIKNPGEGDGLRFPAGTYVGTQLTQPG